MYSSKQIAKNTFFLYVRMILILIVTLYTSRVVLCKLGVSDYGVYNVVGGVISLITFISQATAGATQRFLTFELGQGHTERLTVIFQASHTVFIILSVIVVLFAETVGLWLLHHVLVIPSDRVTAAEYVYQFSIIACIISFCQIPFNAVIIAHEKMGVFALFSFAEVLFKLGIVLSLDLFRLDKLILYAGLISLSQLLVYCLYFFYCRHYFSECVMKICKQVSYLKEICGFAVWTLFGNLAVVSYTQGLNILLNMFFGPTVNAARGISVQVQSAVRGFVSSFQTAINPQITKNYASNNIQQLHSLIISSSKLSYFLMLFFVIPISFEADWILQLWLTEVPEHTKNFLVFSLAIMQLNTLSNPITTASSATGEIKKYQVLTSLVLLLILPSSYLLLKIGCHPESVYLVHLVIALLTQIVRLAIVCPMIKMKLSTYLIQVVVPILIVTILSVSISFLLCHYLADDYHLISIILSLIVIALSVICGLSKREKKVIFNSLKIF